METSSEPVYSQSAIDDAYVHCIRIAHGHYENFPVGSLLIPKQHRPAVAAVYAFARYADDLADEGHDGPEERLVRISAWRDELLQCLESPKRPEFIALGDTIRRYNMPLDPFLHLLEAFAQDAIKSSYSDFDEVLDYCRRSANPVGRIMLFLFGRHNTETVPPSDALCTGLQLANFWQDIAVDRNKPRVYIPEADMRRFGVVRADFDANHANAAFKKLLAFEVQRTREYFWESTSLFRKVPFRLRLELRAIWRGGMSILDMVERQDFDVLAHRPSLTWLQYASILARSFFPSWRRAKEFSDAG